MNLNGRAVYHRVWEFRAPGDGRCWIAWACGFNEPKPAPGSAAARWFDEVKPAPTWQALPSVLLPREVAVWLASHRRRQARIEGSTVLAGRVYSGSAPRRPCLGFDSIRQAAAALGISRRKAARRAGFADYDGRRDRSNLGEM